MFRECRVAAVLFDDGNNFVFDELPRRLPHQLFFVVQLRIKIDEVDSAISSHTALLVKAPRPGRSPPRARKEARTASCHSSKVPSEFIFSGLRSLLALL